MYTLF